MRLGRIASDREHAIDPGATGVRVELRVVATFEALHRREDRPFGLRCRLRQQVLQQQIDAAVDGAVRQTFVALDPQNAHEPFAWRRL